MEAKSRVECIGKIFGMKRMRLKSLMSFIRPKVEDVLMEWRF